LPSFSQEQNAVDPQVSQQIETLNRAYDEAFNQNDAEAISDLFTADAVETAPDDASAGLQAIEDRYKSCLNFIRTTIRQRSASAWQVAVKAM
jgi:ketosteroid isomerase-like protein